jgi:hypothetical protein
MTLQLKKQDEQRVFNVTLWRVRVTIFAKATQFILHIVELRIAGSAT